MQRTLERFPRGLVMEMQGTHVVRGGTDIQPERESLKAITKLECQPSPP